MGSTAVMGLEPHQPHHWIRRCNQTPHSYCLIHALGLATGSQTPPIVPFDPARPPDTSVLRAFDRSPSIYTC